MIWLSRFKEGFLIFLIAFISRFRWALVFVVFLYVPIAMLWVHKIDDSPEIDISRHLPAAAPGMRVSQVVATATALIERETGKHHWTPNDPIFLPGAWLDRMPAYQRGITAALSRFAIEMSDQIGRTRGSSRIDEDLDMAAGLLKYPPDVWMWNPSVSLLPTASSQKQYQAAMKALRRYNDRLARGEAVFERRADNLQQTLERFASDLGSASAAVADRIDGKNRPWLDLSADEMYYDVKGKMYAYRLLVRALRVDFADVIREKQLGPAWDQLEISLGDGAQLGDFWVFNNAPDSQFLPNHLTGIGFYLLRGRTQLREIIEILQK